MGSFSTWLMGHITGDSSRTQSSSLCCHFQWHKAPIGYAASKKSSRNTAGKAAYVPSRLLPQNSCDPPNLPYDFSKLPPALRAQLLYLPRFAATSDFPLGRSRTHTRQLLFPSSWGTSILHAGPGTSKFPACGLQPTPVGCLLPHSPQNLCRGTGHLSLQMCPFSRNGIHK